MSQPPIPLVWEFENRSKDGVGTPLPLLITKIPINGVLQDLTLAPGERKLIFGFDMRKTLLPAGAGYPAVPSSNFWLLSGSQDWTAKGLGASVKDGALFGFPDYLRIELPGAGTEVVPGTLATITGLVVLLLGADIFLTGCDIDAHNGQHSIAGAPAPLPTANVIYVLKDPGYSQPPDANNGAISWGVLKFVVADADNIVIPTLLWATPTQDPTAAGAVSTAVDYVEDTWQRIQSPGNPKHSLVATLLDNGKVLIASGTEAPLCTVLPDAVDCWLFDPATLRITRTGDCIMPGFDVSTRKLPPGPFPWNGRVYLMGGFNDNDTLLTPSCIIQGYDPPTETWNSAWKSAVSVPPRVLNPAAPGVPTPTGGIYNLLGGMVTDIPLDPTDAALFGNGAGAIIVAFSEAGNPGPFPPADPPGTLYAIGSMYKGPFPGFNNYTTYSGIFTQRFPQFRVNPSVPVPPGFWAMGSASAPGFGASVVPDNTVRVNLTGLPNHKLVLSLTVRRNAMPISDLNLDRLKVPRSLVSGSVVLPSGKIMVGGGFGAIGDPGVGIFSPGTARCEILDPATGLVSNAPDMIEAVLSEPPCMVEGADGKIYSIGGVKGFGGLGPTDKVQIFDEGLFAWALGAPMPTGPLGRGTVLAMPDGSILWYGGSASEAAVNSSPRTFLYHPDTDTHEECGNLLVPVTGGYAFIGADGNVYQVGGHTGFVLQDDNHLNRQVQRFTLASKQWTRLRDLPAWVGGQWYRNVSLPSGKVFQYGGITVQQRNSFAISPTNAAALYCPPKI